jgi:hypothetical protein
MGKQRIKSNYRRRVLRLPDLDHSKLAVLNSLASPGSLRVYQYAIEQFIAWYCSEPRLAFNRIVVVRSSRARMPVKPLFQPSAICASSWPNRATHLARRRYSPSAQVSLA